MDQEKSDGVRGEATEPPNRRQGPRRTLDVVIGDDDQRKEDRRKATPGWKKLLEIVFGQS